MITHYSTHYGNHLNTSCVKCVKFLQLKDRQDIKSTVQDSQKSTQSQKFKTVTFVHLFSLNQKDQYLTHFVYTITFTQAYHNNLFFSKIVR